MVFYVYNVGINNYLSNNFNNINNDMKHQILETTINAIFFLGFLAIILSVCDLAKNLFLKLFNDNKK